ncbi:SNF2 family N-terminal domain-containing protein, partial [Blyttiomyces helicus]
ISWALAWLVLSPISNYSKMLDPDSMTPDAEAAIKAEQDALEADDTPEDVHQVAKAMADLDAKKGGDPTGPQVVFTPNSAAAELPSATDTANPELEVKRYTLNKIQQMVRQATLFSKFLGGRIAGQAEPEPAAAPEPAASSSETAPAAEKPTEEPSDEPAEEPEPAPKNTRRKSARHSKAGVDAQPTPVKPQKRKAESERKPKRVKRNTEMENHAPIEKSDPTSRQPALITGATMREYQLVGMEWLVRLYQNGINGILADEMGLGKTLQTIAFLAHLFEMGCRGPFLIVVPLSTLSNWMSEIARFAPKLKALQYHGPPEHRANLRRTSMKMDANFPIIVTSYEICMNDRPYLAALEWKYIVIDEGHRIKNYNCRLVRELRMYTTSNKLLLTGTPLQNNLSELWSLLNFLMPEVFVEIGAFEDMFDSLKDLNVGEDQSQFHDKSAFVSALHEILKPFLLRRVKADVELGLPKKREYLIYAPLVPKQRELYRAAIDGNLREAIVNNLAVGDGERPDGPARDEAERERLTALRLKAAGVSVKTQKLQSLIVQLRKICNHPYLFELGNDDELEMENPVGPLSGTPRPGNSTIGQSKKLPEIVLWSGKMLMLERMLPALFERGHKVLIFSQMTRVLDVLCDWAGLVKGWPYCRLDGAVKMDDRASQIALFNSDPNVKLFLLSTRAGGLGINLTSADTVILFDSDWNPQADLQAQDRVHRIGQTRPVIIYRFVTSGTVETHILDKAGAKRKLEKLVIHKNHFKGVREYYASKQSTSIAEIASILATEESESINSANVVEDDAYHPERILSDADLERIMDRSDAAYETAGTAESGVVSDRFAIIEESADADGDGLGRIGEHADVGLDKRESAKAELGEGEVDVDVDAVEA